MASKPPESRGWRCIELEDGSRHLHFSSPSIGLGDVGELIVYERGGEEHRGTLVATSEMGVTSIDLFNDILVCEEDLCVLLKNQGIRPLPSKAGLLIQAYLIFAREARVNVFDPINTFTKEHVVDETILIDNTNNVTDQPLEVSTTSGPGRRFPQRQSSEAASSLAKSFASIENVNDDDDANYEPIGTIEDLDDLEDLDEPEYKPPKKSQRTEPRKKTEKPKKTGLANLTIAEKKEAIKEACVECGGNVENVSHWDQRSYETHMSQHLWEVHEIKDEIMQEDEYHEKLNQNYPTKMEKIDSDGSKMIKCPKCPALLKKEIGLRKHLQWHDLLDRSGKMQQGGNFPCVHCPAFFDTVAQHRSHEDQVHPFIKFKCRACDKSFSTRQNRAQHWSLIHKIDANETCEFCGKVFINNRQLREHIRSHDESKSCTCELCGKAFKNPYALRKHSRWHAEATIKCEFCEDKFIYADALETHLVRVHKKTRKFTCEFCGTQFIHQKHWRRHLNKHTASPQKIYPTQTIRRGYTKTSNKYWEEKKLYPGLNLVNRNQPKPAQKPITIAPAGQTIQQVLSNVSQSGSVQLQNGQNATIVFTSQMPVQNENGNNAVQVNQVFPVENFGPFSVRQNNQ